MDCCLVFEMQLVSEFLQAPQRPPHSFDMGQLLEEMQQIDQQSYRQAPQRGRYTHVHKDILHLPICYSFIFFCFPAPDVAALALSGDWAAEFLSNADSAASPGQAGLDPADADWTREFISDVEGQYMFKTFICSST